jgi:hypothetical protein
MRRRCEIGIGQTIARKPVSVPDQIADIAQMIADVGARRAHKFHIRRAAPRRCGHESFIDFFRHKPVRDFTEEFLMKPVEQAADLDAFMRRIRQKPVIAQRMAVDLVEIFGKRAGARHHGAAILDPNRRLSRRIQNQEIFAPLIDLFFEKRGFEAVFANQKPGEARMRTKRMVIKKRHCHAVYGSRAQEANIGVLSSSALNAKWSPWLEKPYL